MSSYAWQTFYSHFIQCIKAWFRNHKRPTVSGSSGRLNFKKKRMLQAWQAYHDLTYESKWKAEIDSQWTEYVNNWKAENPELPVDQTRFAFMNTFIKSKFAEETEEMKEDVENHRRSLS